jgi:enoyl-CoA hydratase
MGSLVSYRLDGPVATVTMDDGKVNALSPAMLAELVAAFDQADADGAAVILTGRADRFSAGFDLNVLREGGHEAAEAMLRAGFELALRMLSFPAPVIVACNGHAVAMGAFLLLSGDYRIGVRGPYRIAANEVAIGLTMPYAAVELCRQRLTPAALVRAITLAETFSPDQACAAGFLDRAVDAEELHDAARTAAEAAATTLNRDAHAGSKARVRAGTLQAIRAAIDSEFPA